MIENKYRQKLKQIKALKKKIINKGTLHNIPFFNEYLFLHDLSNACEFCLEKIASFKEDKEADYELTDDEKKICEDVYDKYVQSNLVLSFPNGFMVDGDGYDYYVEPTPEEIELNRFYELERTRKMFRHNR